MLDVLRFWFDRGIDGFRIDASAPAHQGRPVSRQSAQSRLVGPAQTPYDSLLPLYTTDQPGVLDIVAELRALSPTSTAERVLIGEIYLPDRTAGHLLRRRRPRAPSAVQLPPDPDAMARARRSRALVETYEAALPAGAWPNWVLGNHDRSRIASRVGAAQARVAAMLLLTLRGTPTLYHGDELGMHDVADPARARCRTRASSNLPGLGLGRDPERTPMQWDATPNAGFSSPTARPWLPLAADSATVNVASQLNDSQSMLTLYRRLIELRRSTPALSVGSYRELYVDADLLIFARDGLTVMLNFSHLERELPNGLAIGKNVVLSTYLDNPAEPDRIRPDEGRILA